MDPDLPPGMGNFFQGMFGDMLKILRTDSPLQWDLALQLAVSVAAGDEAEANVDPIERIRLEELVRIAELHVADVTGMTTTPSGRPLNVRATSRAEWARLSLEGWRPILERVAEALRPEGESPAVPADPDERGDLNAMIGQWAKAVAPAMLAMQVGSMVGHLAQRTLGQYELPLPRLEGDEIAAVPANARSFAEDWSLPAQDVALWLAVRDVATHAVLSRPHVRARLETLLVAHAHDFRPDPSALESSLGGLSGGELGDLGDLGRLLGAPGALGSVAETPELARVRAELAALVSALEGYVEWVTDVVAGRLIGAHSAIREALRRRRVERGEEERAAEGLFGIVLDQDALDRGERFVRGVLERRGESELAKLWVVEANLPTPAEVDAPGLWIERVNLEPL